MLVMDKGIPPPAGWSFFDRAYCISLRKRADRREAVRAEFARVGLVVEFVMADKAANPEQGIYESSGFWFLRTMCCSGVFRQIDSRK